MVRIRISNAVPFIDGDELSLTPAAQKHYDIWALIDTGATMTVIDVRIQRDLMLRQQASAPVLFPNMPLTEYHPTYTCAISFFGHYSPGSKAHDWPDWKEVLVFPLDGRAFQAVIGMDILSSVVLRLNHGLPK